MRSEVHIATPSLQAEPTIEEALRDPQGVLDERRHRREKGLLDEDFPKNEAAGEHTEKSSTMDLTGTAEGNDQSRQKIKVPNREGDCGQKEHGSRDSKV